MAPAHAGLDPEQSGMSFAPSLCRIGADIGMFDPELNPCFELTPPEHGRRVVLVVDGEQRNWAHASFVAKHGREVAPHCKSLTYGQAGRLGGAI